MYSIVKRLAYFCWASADVCLVLFGLGSVLTIEVRVDKVHEDGESE
jgi:hypothetical protein